MNVNQKGRIYNPEDLNWNELSVIGIDREEMETTGILEELLQGKQAGPVHLHLMLYGIFVEMDATLRILEVDGKPIVDIIGLKADDSLEEYE